MTMPPRLRKLTLTAHVTFSVGWLGAVGAYLGLAIVALTGNDPQTVRAMFVSMELIGWFVIVPLSLTALLTGLVQSLGTEWGLFRHYWVLTKFVLTVGGITILLLHMPMVSRVVGVRAETPLLNAALGAVPHATFVVHAGGGLLVLLAATALSVYKPWGLTPYGRHALSQALLSKEMASMRDTAVVRRADDAGSSTAARWRLYVLLGIIGLVLLIIFMHLTGGPIPHH
jgi:hypothetical protein